MVLMFIIYKIVIIKSFFLLKDLFSRPTPLLGTKRQELTQPAEGTNLPNPLNTIPKTSLDMLLNSLTESSGVEPSTARTMEPQEPLATVMKELLSSENSNKDFLQKDDNFLNSLGQVNTLILQANSMNPTDNSTASVSAEEVVEEEIVAIDPPVSPGPGGEASSPGPGGEVSPGPGGEVSEASSPGHVTLQSFLAAISQSREEDTKQDLTEGPVLLPFRTTLRTTTTTTTTPTTTTMLQTTTKGKLWFTVYCLRFMVYMF